MKLGLWGARADGGGLASQTEEYFNHLSPTKTLLIDLRQVNEAHGKVTPFYPDRFPGADIYPNIPGKKQVDEFLNDIDVVLCAETPYTYYLFEEARRRGIKTVLHYNYEFLDYLKYPEWAKPDLLLSPSIWHYLEVVDLAKDTWGCDIKFIPVPIDRTKLPFRLKTKALNFLHIAGHKTYLDRNGTDIVFNAVQYIQNPDVTITVRTQEPLQYKPDNRLKIELGERLNYWDNYKNEDVLLLPRRYGGQSLQLNEAMSTGMIPLMPDIEPQSLFLMESSLLPATKSGVAQTRISFDYYDVDPKDLATKIDQLASSSENDISLLSNHSNFIADMWSWESLLPQFERALCT